MHTSSLTQVSALLGSPPLEIATVYAISSSAYNVANDKRSSSLSLLSVPRAIAIDLIKLIGSVFPAKYLGATQPHLALSDKPTTLVDQCGWTITTADLQAWDYMLQNPFSEVEGNMQISLADTELRLHHCLTEIMLYHEFLGCLAESTKVEEHYGIGKINKGRACVAAATHAVSHISERLAQIPSTHLTWSSAHTIFISSLTLLVAAAFTHADERHMIRTTVCEAIQILQDRTYGNSDTKKSYLDFIQTLSVKVMMPIDFGSVYQRRSSVEHLTMLGSATTEQTANWCDDFSQDAPGLAKFQLGPTRSDEASSDEWGFDGRG